MDGALAARIIAPPQPLVSHQHAAESARYGHGGAPLFCLRVVDT